MIDADEVVQGYRWILGRMPESPAMIDFHCNHKDFETARFRLLNSGEFRDTFRKHFANRPFLWYVHIPKTAGTAIRNGFSWVFGERFFWHPVTEGLEDQSGSVFNAIRENPNFFDYFDFGGGHLSKDLIPVLKASRKVVFITLLRDPIERALSLYFYAQNQPSHDAHGEVRNRTLWEALQLKDIYYHHVYLEQIRYLCGDRDIDACEKAMSENSYVLGKTSKISSFLIHLHEKFGIPIPEVGRTNESPAGYIDRISGQARFDDALELIHRVNEPERQLIERCQPIFDTT
jgi:hypothetical protein